MRRGLTSAKRELLQEFLENLRRRSYAVEQLEEPFHHYRRESDGGLIDFSVGRDEDENVVVLGIKWDTLEHDADEEWAVYDCMFKSEELTFPQFVDLVRQQAKASLRDSDPFVDEDGDYLRGNREDAAAAREGEYDTLGREFTEETQQTPEVSFWQSS